MNKYYRLCELDRSREEEAIGPPQVIYHKISVEELYFEMGCKGLLSFSGRRSKVIPRRYKAVYHNKRM